MSFKNMIFSTTHAFLLLSIFLRTADAQPTVASVESTSSLRGALPTAANHINENSLSHIDDSTDNEITTWSVLSSFETAVRKLLSACGEYEEHIDFYEDAEIITREDEDESESENEDEDEEESVEEEGTDEDEDESVSDKPKKNVRRRQGCSKKYEPVTCKNKNGKWETFKNKCFAKKKGYKPKSDCVEGDEGVEEEKIILT